MSSSKNVKLALLLLIIGAVAIALLGVFDPRCRHNKDCSPNRACERGACVDVIVVEPPRSQSCLADAQCGLGEICVGGICDKLEPELPTCALNEPVKGCECKAPLQEETGRCVRLHNDPRCADPTFLRMCSRVVVEASSSINDCGIIRFRDLIISNDSVASLLGSFSDQVALLFPTGQPVPNSDWPPPEVESEYQRLLRNHLKVLYDAKMIVMLGRASPIGHRQRNESLAARRLNMAKNFLYDVCKEVHTEGECAQFMQRFLVAVIGEGRAVGREEFIRAFHPTLWRGGGPVREKRWTLPVNETMMTTPGDLSGGRDIVKQNGVSRANAERVLAVALGRSRSRKDQRIAQQFMNQTVMFIPVPCACKRY